MKKIFTFFLMGFTLNVWVSSNAQNTATWTGGEATTTSWTHANNWGGTAPTWGVDLDVIFHAASAGNLSSMIGNASGQHKTIGTLTFNGNVTQNVQIDLRRSSTSSLQLWGVREITVESAANADIAIAFGAPTTGYIRLDNPVLNIVHNGSGTLSLTRLFNGTGVSGRTDEPRGITKSGSGTVHFTGHDNSFQSLAIQSGNLVLESAYTFQEAAKTANPLATIGFGVTNIGSGQLVVNSANFDFDGTIQLNIASVTADSTHWNLFSGSAFVPAMLAGVTGVSSDIAGLTFAENAGVWEAVSGSRKWEFYPQTGKLTAFKMTTTKTLPNVENSNRLFAQQGSIIIGIDSELVNANVKVFGIDGKKLVSQALQTKNTIINFDFTPAVYVVEILFIRFFIAVC